MSSQVQHKYKHRRPATCEIRRIRTSCPAPCLPAAAPRCCPALAAARAWDPIVPSRAWQLDLRRHVLALQRRERSAAAELRGAPTPGRAPTRRTKTAIARPRQSGVYRIAREDGQRRETSGISKEAHDRRLHRATSSKRRTLHVRRHCVSELLLKDLVRDKVKVLEYLLVLRL